MFNAVQDGFQRALAEPAERLFGLLTEIRDNLTRSVELLTEIKTALTEEPEPPPTPPVKLEAVPK